MEIKQRLQEIMKELWESHLEYKKSRPEAEQGYLVLNYNTLFSESISCWRGEQAEKNKGHKTTYRDSNMIGSHGW